MIPNRTVSVSIGFVIYGLHALSLHFLELATSLASKVAEI